MYIDWESMIIAIICSIVLYVVLYLISRKGDK